MRLKFFNKLFFTTSGVFIVTLTLVFVLMTVAVNEAFVSEKQNVLLSCSNTIASELAAEDGDVSEATESVVSTLSKVNDIDIFIIDELGKVVLCSCDDFTVNHTCIHTDLLVSNEFLNNVPEEAQVEMSAIGGIYDQLNYSASKHITLSDGTKLNIVAASDVMTAYELIRPMLGMYAASAIIPLIFMFIAEYSIVYSIIRPLKYMSAAAKSIAKGDFSKRIPVMSNDEIGELSVLFNRMTASLSRTEKTSTSFVSNVSHELKTPMTTISGFIDGIIDGTIDEKDRDYYLKIVSAEVKRLSRLVQSMLNLAKLESGKDSVKPEPFLMSQTLISVVISMEQKISQKDINIVGLDELSETEIVGDKDLIHQVVYNLVDNAVKFTPDSGVIEFHLHRIENSLELKVRNSGEGIPAKDLPHIFERFYKIDKSRSDNKDSLGLGLFICKTIVDLHFGTISADSVEGEYTEFSVRLPISDNKNGDRNERRIR
jgi:signal transduction histidine kinase